MQKGFRLPARLSKINPSSTLAITAKVKEFKAQGWDVVNLAAGEPDFDTPDFIKAKAVEAIQSGFTKYTPTTGTPELKKQFAKNSRKITASPTTPARSSFPAEPNIASSIPCLFSPALGMKF